MKDEFVMVPRKLTREMLDELTNDDPKKNNVMKLRWEQALRVSPTEQYQGEVERLRAELGEVKGEYDRAANKVEELRGIIRSLEQNVLTYSQLSASMHAQLAERGALLRELAEAAEMFSCSAHCETSDAGDALELLNKILARVNSHKSPKCKVCGYMLHPDGYCSFRDCGVPGKGTKALSASADAVERICTHPEGCTHCSWCGFKSGMAEPGILKDLTHKGPPAKPTSSLVHYGAPAREMPCGAPVVTSDHMLMQLTQVTKPNSTTPVECDERTAFDAAYERGDFYLEEQRSEFKYQDYRRHQAWAVWKVRAALERKS